jgi:hypothetical protein
MPAMSADPASPPSGQPTLPILQRRRIEAELLRHVLAAIAEQRGAEEARALVGEAVRRSAIEQGRRFAAEAPGGPNLDHFAEIQKYWTADDALTIEPIARDEGRFNFDVTRCRYAEMYREMGLGEAGALLSCARDEAFSEGYDPAMTLERRDTIMAGAARCTFRYRRRAAGDGTDDAERASDAARDDRG